MIRVLLVGQTPPPYGGQAIMIEKILAGVYSKIQFIHLRMSFSKEMDEIGKLHWRKILHLIQLITQIFFYRIKYRPTVLYYPPAGAEKVPLLRDVVLLLATRWLFRKTVLHFHAMGLADLYAQLPPWLKLLARWAYFKPDGAIILTPLNHADSDLIQASKTFVIPYGIEDVFPQQETQAENRIPQLLFVGVLRESKGVLVLLHALKILHEQNIPFHAQLVGKFVSQEFEDQVTAQVQRDGLSADVCFSGVLTGSEKWRAFNSADIFCFPTFFESESFGLVVVEAMQCALPVVATNWRGVPSLVMDGETGFIVPVRDSRRLAERLKLLLQDSALAQKMGRQGRERYLQNYTSEKFFQRIEDAFLATIEE
jgi:glycosyltransferase involved in cell wall biosynthesis